MSYWRVKCSSGEAKATLVVAADGKPHAKSIVFDHFLKLVPCEIAWDASPTFWIVIHSIDEMHEADTNET